MALAEPKIFDYSAEIDRLTRQLHECKEREKESDEKIGEILAKNADLPKKLDFALSRAKTKISVAESDANQLKNLLELTLILAENVSGKVRQLDLCKSRVVDCLQRVEDALDLRFCTEGIRSAMANEDYEQAAGHVHRFLSLDNAVFKLDGFSSENSAVDPEVHQDSLEHQYATMKKAEEDLKKIVGSKFDEALVSRDAASMERFFKLFPLLNQHDVGLRKFGAHLKSQIADMASQNFRSILSPDSGVTVDASRSGVLYADCLTILLEGVARIFEVHQPLVESYYGPEHLLTLAEILQEQCDQESSHILDEFVKIRHYNAKAKLIETYSRQSAKFSGKEKIDPTELDQMLSEVALLQSRTQLYFRFLKRRIVGTLKNLGEKPVTADSSKFAKIKSEKMQNLGKFLRDCRLNCRLQEIMGRYIPMEEYFTRETVQKAIKIDLDENKSNLSIDFQNQPAKSMTSSTSSATLEKNLRSPLVDDVFFIVRKSVQRALSSSNVDCTCAVLNNACALLEMDFWRLVQQRIKLGYPAAGSLAEAYSTAAAAYVSVVQQGKMQHAADGAEKARDEFLQAVNNSDCTHECMLALKDLLGQEFDKQLSQSLVEDKGQQQAKLDSCLSQLLDVAEKFDQLARVGVEQLVGAAATPRIKLAADRLTDFSHCLDEAQFNEFEAGDIFIEQFVFAIDSLLTNHRACLTASNFAHFFDHLADQTADRLEKSALKCSFNRLGALLFDKRVREISAYYASSLYCNSQISGGYAVREKFHRLTQFASLLNVDSVSEAKEFYQSGGQTVAWRLSPNDVRKILSLRVDLPPEEIRKIKI